QNKLSGSVPPFMIFIVILGAIKAWRTHKSTTTEDKNVRLVDRLIKTEKYETDEVSTMQTALSFIIYFGLASTLSALMIYSNSLLPKT
ncbi:hypothetical protein MJH12_02880, partial [bacterium]|nr:hypothetical protein [bacterium]